MRQRSPAHTQLPTDRLLQMAIHVSRGELSRVGGRECLSSDSQSPGTTGNSANQNRGFAVTDRGWQQSARVVVEVCEGSTGDDGTQSSPAAMTRPCCTCTTSFCPSCTAPAPPASFQSVPALDEGHLPWPAQLLSQSASVEGREPLLLINIKNTPMSKSISEFEPIKSSRCRFSPIWPEV